MFASELSVVTVPKLMRVPGVITSGRSAGAVLYRSRVREYGPQLIMKMRPHRMDRMVSFLTTINLLAVTAGVRALTVEGPSVEDM